MSRIETRLRLISKHRSRDGLGARAPGRLREAAGARCRLRACAGRLFRVLDVLICRCRICNAAAAFASRQGAHRGASTERRAGAVLQRCSEPSLAASSRHSNAPYAENSTTRRLDFKQWRYYLRAECQPISFPHSGSHCERSIRTHNSSGHLTPFPNRSSTCCPAIVPKPLAISTALPTPSIALAT